MSMNEGTVSSSFMLEKMRHQNGKTIAFTTRVFLTFSLLLLKWGTEMN